MEAADHPEVLERFHAALDLVESAARKTRASLGSAVELEELRSFGREGLLDAARRFDPSRGVPFRAYATYRVRGAITDGVRSLARLPRRLYARLRALEAAQGVSEGAIEDLLSTPAPPGTPADSEQALDAHLAAMATAMAVGLVTEPGIGEDGELISIDAQASPEDEVGNAEVLGLVKAALLELPHEEGELLRRHYLEGERFDHVAAELGLSKSWASRLHTRAITRLTKRLRGTAP